MGYDLHITRRADWSDEDGPEITLDEWNEFLKTDPEIRQDPDNGPTDFIVSDKGAAGWPLWWDRGEIYTKNPDKTNIQKLVQIAKKIGARVLGDDGEEYK